MERISLENELKNNSYPGRGIIIGRSADGTKAVTAYFIMGRSENSRNRVFVEDGEGIRTQAFDPSKLTDPVDFRNPWEPTSRGEVLFPCCRSIPRQCATMPRNQR